MSTCREQLAGNGWFVMKQNVMGIHLYANVNKTTSWRAEKYVIKR